jgi:hypothetical protein
MTTNFDHWKKFAESSGSKVTKNKEGYKVEGDLILVNCGLTHIPQGLAEVTGTLDISLNPIENFECDLKDVRRLICMGTKPISLKNIHLIKINSAERGKISESDVSIQGWTIEEIKNAQFLELEKSLPELEGIFITRTR